MTEAQQIRIVTVCPSGNTAKLRRHMPRRLIIFQEIINKIEEKGWSHLAAILLPGGFFFDMAYLAPLDFTQRVKHLENTQYSQVILQSFDKLHASSPELHIICGIDGKQPTRSITGDQLIVAWQKQGISGIARKIFPVLQDVNHALHDHHFVSASHDYICEKRFISLGGVKAILCNCYDVFAMSRMQYANKMHYIKYLYNEDILLHGTREMSLLRDHLANKYWQMLEINQPQIALAAIHRFAAPVRDCYWQRHGIASASAVLNGLVIGAAHFGECSPYVNQSTLAAFKVPKIHLQQSQFRKAHYYYPIDMIEYFEVMEKEITIRLFEIPQQAKQ